MTNVVVVAATRTPIGDFAGALKDVSSTTLAAVVIDACIKRATLEKNMVDAVIFGNCMAPLPGNVARVAAVQVGIPVESPAFTIHATCGSGMQAMVCGFQAIRDGDVEIVLAGGVESMSAAPYIMETARWGQRLQHAQVLDMIWGGMQEYPIGGGMGMTAENLAEKYNISREEQDIFACLSHQRAYGAIREGKFEAEITPVTIRQRKGEEKRFDRDEHPRSDVTIDQLAKLPPAFKKGGNVTAGNSSAINDAAAAVVLMAEDKAKEMGIRPLARLVDYAIVGVDPAYMGIGPVPTTKRLLKKVGVSLNDIELIEINEAFAAQYLSCERELGLNREIVNVNGGGIALGHPIGCTGCRIVVTLIHEMIKRDNHLGLATLCAGGGMGFGIIVERV